MMPVRISARSLGPSVQASITTLAVAPYFKLDAGSDLAGLNLTDPFVFFFCRFEDRESWGPT
jgi:hypothetical protein